ncbi:MAG: RecX family transcriptional regulator [Patescibacteria group bacterium]|nr:RecX family transcriptional regulator [Patescibacteria group bacterium]
MPRAQAAKSNGFEAAYNQAVKFLAVRMHTVGELQAKLLRRFSRDTVRPVLKALEESDFLNDMRYAQIFVENLKRYKDFGYYGIKVKLQQRKVPTEIALAALDEFFSPEDEMMVARRVVKKLKRMKRERYEQVARSLSSKGFHGDIISQVLREGFIS